VPAVVASGGFNAQRQNHEMLPVYRRKTSLVDRAEKKIKIEETAKR